jgi:hypothetical protein
MRRARTGTSGAHHPGCQYTAVAAWPITVLSLLSPLATLHWQRIGCRSQVLAVITCTLIVIPLWHGVLTGVNSSLLFLQGIDPIQRSYSAHAGNALIRERLASRAMRLPALAMLVGTFGAMTAVLIRQTENPVTDGKPGRKTR